MTKHKQLLISTSNLFLAVVALALLVLLAACSAPAATPPSATAAPTLEPPAAAGNALVVYSGRSESLVGPIIEQFEAETGIDVAVRYGSTSELAALLLEEGARSPADIFYAQDPSGLGAVSNAGLLAPLPTEIAALVPATYQAADATWVGITGRARVIVYNTAAIGDPASELPADIYDFIDPAWQGRIGWAPTNGSFQAMVTAMRVVWGEDKTRDWLAGIQANNPLVFEGNTPIVQAVGAGEVEVGFVNHYYLYRFLAEEGEGFGARNYFQTGGGPGSLIMVSGAGILQTAPNRANAERLLNYLLSAEGQTYFSGETFEYPLAAGVAPDPALPPLDSLSNAALDISVNQYTDLQGTVQLLQETGILP